MDFVKMKNKLEGAALKLNSALFRMFQRVMTKFLNNIKDSMHGNITWCNITQIYQVIMLKKY